MKEIDDLASRGALSAEQAARARQQAQDDLDKATDNKARPGSERTTIGFHESGVLAGYSAFVRQNFGSETNWDKLNADESKKQTELLRKIQAAVSGEPDPTSVFN